MDKIRIDASHFINDPSKAHWEEPYDTDAQTLLNSISAKLRNLGVIRQFSVDTYGVDWVLSHKERNKTLDDLGHQYKNFLSCRLLLRTRDSRRLCQLGIKAEDTILVSNPQPSLVASPQPSLSSEKVNINDEIIKTLTTSAEQSFNDKRDFKDKLKKASDSDVYKYAFLFNVSAIEENLTLTRLQAQQGFNLSKNIAIIGFLIVAIAIILNVYLMIVKNENLKAVYLTGIAGALVEFIAVVFVFLYSKTLSQINLTNDKLVDMQKTLLAHFSEGIVSEMPPSEASPKNAPLIPTKANDQIQPFTESGG